MAANGEVLLESAVNVRVTFSERRRISRRAGFGQRLFGRERAGGRPSQRLLAVSRERRDLLWPVRSLPEDGRDFVSFGLPEKRTPESDHRGFYLDKAVVIF